MEEYGEKLSILRFRLRGKLTPYYDNDYNLLHWLVGWNGDLDKIEPKLKAHLELREVLGLDDEKLEESEAVAANFEGFNPFFPENGLRNAFDKQGNYVAVYQIGTVDNSSLMNTTRMSDFLRNQIYYTELMRRQVNGLEKDAGEVLGVTIIYDLAGLRLGKVGVDVVGGSMARVTNTLQENFPELSSKMIIINASKIVFCIWQIVRMVLAKKTLEKVVFLGKNWKNDILKYITAENLPVAYGGILQDKSGKYHLDSMCRDPDPMPEGGIMIPPDMTHLADELTQVSLKPSQKIILQVKVEATLKLQWYWQANGDLEFGIHFTPNNMDHSSNVKKPLIPRFTLTTSYYPESGEITEAVGDGICTVQFENTTGYLLSTKLNFNIKAFEVNMFTTSGQLDEKELKLIKILPS